MRRLWTQVVAALAAVTGWRIFKPAVFLACLAPAAILAYGLCRIFLWDQADALGPDPATFVLHETGRDALSLLLITLSITPLRRLLKLNRLQAVRRMLGVWAFAYGLLHLLAYLVFNQNCFSWEACEFDAIWTDLTKRPFIFVGMLTFSLLLPLAVTSTNGWVRRLKKRWQTLHRLAYVAAVTGIIHFAWGQKADVSEPIRWAGYLAVLFAIRLYFAYRKRQVALRTT